LLAAKSGGGAWLWSIPEGLPVVEWEEASGVLAEAAFSPDGLFLAMAWASGEMSIRDGRSGAQLRREPQPLPWAKFYPQRDGRLLATSLSEGTVRVWNVPSGDILATISVGEMSSAEVALSPDAEHLALLRDQRLEIWSVATGERQAWGICASGGRPHFSPDGTRLLTRGRENLALWDVQTSAGAESDAGEIQPVRTWNAVFLHDDRGRVNSVAFAPDGRVLSGGNDRRLNLWDVTGGASDRSLTFHGGEVTACEASPAGDLIASGSTDGTAALWGLDGIVRAVLEAHGEGVRACGFSPDGKLLVTAGRGEWKLWKVAKALALNADDDAHGLARGAAPPARLVSQKISADGRWIVATLQGECDADNPTTRPSSVQVWSADSGEIAGRLIPGVGAYQGLGSDFVCEVTCTALSPDGRLAAVGTFFDDYREGLANEQAVRICELPSLRELRSWSMDQIPRSLAFTPNSELLVVAASEGCLQVREVVTGREIELSDRSWKGGDEIVVLADGEKLASAFRDKNGVEEAVSIWSLRAAERLAVFPGSPYHAVRGLVASIDGRYLLRVSSSDMISILDLARGVQLSGVEGTAVAISPDGRWLATALRKRGLALWRTATGEAVTRSTDGAARFRLLAFSPDGTWVASMSSDGCLVLWGAPTLERAGRFPGLSADSLAWIPGGSALVLAAPSGSPTLLAVEGVQPSAAEP